MLWETEYGRILVIKLTVVLGVLFVAHRIRQVLQQRILPVEPSLRPAHGTDTALALSERPRPAPELGRRELRRWLWTEVALATTILALSAALVAVSPARLDAGPGERPSRTGAVSDPRVPDPHR